ncbi:MAG TPA: GNAT family N-acetyltransferase [Gemmatimonadales bacterium]|nr:GNAT family N-acetyltransferase [Gemmatimonadales bacterium]
MNLPEVQPRISTERLVLRPFRLDDAPAVVRLAGDPRVADTTLNIPHPYPDGAAEQWVSGRAEEYAQGTAVTYAVSDRRTGELVGAIGLHLYPRFARAEMGYWIGVPYWNRGYGTEAARAMLRFGFETLGLHRIYAAHFARNPASGRVMEKVGMRREGVWRQHIRREGGPLEDAVVYGILRSEWRP